VWDKFLIQFPSSPILEDIPGLMPILILQKRTPEDLFKRSFQAYFLLKCLEETDFFTKDGIDTSSDDKKYVAGHILRHIMMLPCNAHEVSECNHQ
jgi:hypothetical protein